MGAYGYYACDPFHENAPPVKGKQYLNLTGAAIDKMYRRFDENSVWVIQGWTLDYQLVKNVDVNNLIILDLNSTRVINNPKLKNIKPLQACCTISAVKRYAGQAFSSL